MQTYIPQLELKRERPLLFIPVVSDKGVFANQPILRTGNPLGSYADFYYPVMTMGQLRALRTKAKSHAINNLVNLNVQSLRENLKPQSCHVIALSIQQGLGLRFSLKDLTLG